MKFKLLLIFNLTTTIIFAQNGSVRGVITTEAGQALPGVNVILWGTTIGSTTQADGKFEIKNVPEGKYTISVSMIGFVSYEHSVSVKSQFNL